MKKMAIVLKRIVLWVVRLFHNYSLKEWSRFVPDFLRCMYHCNIKDIVLNQESLRWEYHFFMVSNRILQEIPKEFATIIVMSLRKIP